MTGAFAMLRSSCALRASACTAAAFSRLSTATAAVEAAEEICCHIAELAGADWASGGVLVPELAIYSTVCLPSHPSQARDGGVTARNRI